MEWYSWIILAFIASSFATITLAILIGGLPAFWEETKNDFLKPIWNGVKVIFLFILVLGIGWIILIILQVNNKLRARQSSRQRPIPKPEQPGQPS